MPSYIDNATSEYGGHPDIKGLPLADKKAQAEVLIKTTGTLADQGKAALCPWDFAEPFRKFTETHAKVQNSLQEMQRYRTVFEGASKKISAQKAADASIKKTSRDAKSRALRASAVPASLAKAGADFLQDIEDDKSIVSPHTLLPGAQLAPQLFDKIVLVRYSSTPVEGILRSTQRAAPTTTTTRLGTPVRWRKQIRS